MKKFFIDILDWIYKKKCYFCRSSNENSKMCTNCYDELEYLDLSPKAIINGTNIYCCGIYENNLLRLIRGIKFHNQRDLAFFQAKFMYKYWKDLEYSDDFQIVPVPQFRNKKYRKYNHMELVAEHFSKLSGYDINLKLIKRIKNTKPQYNLSRIERMNNLNNAFTVDATNHSNKKILIIDDIFTTGATFENIILELKKNNINDIVCLSTTTPNTQ